MRRRTFLSALSAAAVFAGVAVTTLPARARRPQRSATPLDVTPHGIYLVGDSIARGRGATWEGETAREQVRTCLQDAHPEWDVFLETEATFGSGWKVADAQAAITATPPTSDTALIWVMVGTNDFDGNQGATSRTSIGTFRISYPALITQLHAAAPAAQIIGCSVWEAATSGSNVRSDFDQAIQSAVLAVGGVYVDLTGPYGNSVFHGPAGTPEEWYGAGTVSDTFHPNFLGHAEIARRVLAASGA